MPGKEPVDIGTDRQLFVDDFWIDGSSGVERVLHQPEKREIAIPPDKPWEAGGVYYSIVFEDKGKYRMWYRCDPVPKGPDSHDSLAITAYAESSDGIHWEKPDLGLIEYQGSKHNNLVWTEPGINFAPFKDSNPDAKADELYKAVIRDSRVILALKSADGIEWSLMREEPILDDPPFDTLNLAFWDDWQDEYVLYARGTVGEGTPLKREHDVSIWKEGFRWIRRSTSKDFLNWTPLAPISAGDTPYEDFYTNSCVRYERAPGTYLMFPSRFVPYRTPDPSWGAPGLSDIVFMSSRDSINFDRSFMEGFVRPGRDKENWHERGIYMELGILQTSPEEMSMYGMEHKQEPDCRLVRYALRTDGFVSVNGGYSGGEFTTRPLTFEGRELELNYSTSAVGSMQVEVQDLDGKAIPGFTLDDCPEMFADKIDGKVAWEGETDVSGLAGKPVRLRFALMDADLYAFKFN